MKSNRIKLLNCDEYILKTLLENNSSIAKELDLNVPQNWSEHGAEIFEYVLEKIAHQPTLKTWWTYLPIHIESNTLIGTCGYKGAPDESGMIELGYEIAKDFRNQGYATEVTQLLVAKAFEHPQVKIIQAHTLSEENASVKVLRKNNFQFVEEMVQGTIWKWILKKNIN